MALRATRAIEKSSALSSFFGLLINSRLKVVQQIELHEIYQARGNFIADSVLVRIGCLIVGRRSLDLILSAIQDHTRWCGNAGAAMSLHHFRVDRLLSHLITKRPVDILSD